MKRYLLAIRTEPVEIFEFASSQQRELAIEDLERDWPDVEWIKAEREVES